MTEGVLCDIVERGYAGHARNAEQHQLPPNPTNLRRNLLQTIERLEYVAGGKALCAGNDGTRDREHRIFIVPEEIAQGDVAFGDPWSIIKQACCLEEWRHLDFHGSRTDLSEQTDCLLPGILRGVITKEFQIAISRNAHS